MVYRYNPAWPVPTYRPRARPAGIPGEEEVNSVGEMSSNLYRGLFVTLLLVPLLLSGGSGAAAGSTNDACLACHGQEGLKVQVDGKEVSLYVAPEEFQGSVHGSLDCTVCHKEIRGVPHENPSYGPEFSGALNESCGRCHADVVKEYESSIHGQGFKKGVDAASCTDCHGTHDIRPVDDPASLVYPQNIPKTCGSCHQGTPLKTYYASFHGKAVTLGSMQSATCADCHGAHDILAADTPGSRVSTERRPETCGSCHRKAEPSFAQGKVHLDPEAKDDPGAAAVYYTGKFFTWLTILTITALVLHIEIELYGEWRRNRKKDKNRKKEGGK